MQADVYLVLNDFILILTVASLLLISIDSIGFF